MQITRQGALLQKTPDVLARVKQDLVVAPFTTQTAFPKKFKVFTETPTHVVVPYHWAVKAFPGVGVTDSRTEGDAAALEFAGTLKAELHQPDAVASVMHALHHTGGALLCLATGLGKTTCALCIACKLRRKTLVVVHKEFLARQWKERIAQYAPMATVSMVQGSLCDTSGDFVIAMVQTLVTRKYPASTFDACSLLIWDEVHHAAAEVFSQVMFSINCPYTLGLTATPDRRDRLGKVVEWFLGDIAFQIKRTHQISTEVRTCTYSCDTYKQPPPLNRRGDVCFPSVMTTLTIDQRRTLLIASQAVAVARTGRDVLVLSHRRQHCLDICGAVSHCNVGCSTYLGGDKEVPTTQVIVATYALTSEGFDCPRLSALVLATPASDVEQACGRVMRGAATQNALIIDIVDSWGVCYAQHAKRKAFYKKSGFSVQAAPIHPEGSEYAFVE